MSRIKEPHFYSTDLELGRVQNRDEYNSLFDEACELHGAVGEASACYLYSHTAVPNILQEYPNAKFIVCLRNPVDMAYSFHGQLQLFQNENLARFEDAWHAQWERQKGRKVPRLCRDPKLLYYGSVCALGSQLERLYQYCDRVNVHVLTLDDIRRDSRSTYQGVLNFLGVCDDGREQFSVVNAASQTRSKNAARMVASVNNLRRRLGIPFLNTGLMGIVRRINTTSSKRDRMQESTRALLTDYFRDEVKKLESLIGRDLSDWEKRA